MSRLLSAVAGLWRRATYRTTPRPHPHLAGGIAVLRGRLPQHELEWR